jgi:hypothetical protein
MHVEIKEVTAQVQPQTLAALAARLERLEKALGLTGDPLTGGFNLDIEVAGAVTIHAKEIRLIARDLAQLQAGASEVELMPGKVTVSTPGAYVANSSTAKYSAASLTMETASATCTGVLHSDTVVTGTIVARVYTPGVGNQS